MRRSSVRAGRHLLRWAGQLMPFVLALCGARGAAGPAARKWCRPVVLPQPAGLAGSCRLSIGARMCAQTNPIGFASLCSSLGPGCARPIWAQLSFEHYRAWAPPPGERKSCAPVARRARGPRAGGHLQNQRPSIELQCAGVGARPKLKTAKPISLSSEFSPANFRPTGAALISWRVHLTRLPAPPKCSLAGVLTA